MEMKEQWLMPGAVVPVDAETTAALVAEIKRLICVVGGMALDMQPAQQQEPVAWFRYESVYEYKNQLARCTPKCIGAFPVYTSPPRKPWVGLTQQDIDIAFDDTQEGGGFDEFARAIEAKLKERNT